MKHSLITGTTKATLLTALSVSIALAQHPDSLGSEIFYPSRLKVGDMRHAAGVSLSRPPDEVVEEFAAVLTTPLLEYQVQYGLAENFILEGKATTIFASNHFSAGGKWIFGNGPFGFSIGTDLAFWFGSLKIEGFDNTVSGWTLYPNVSAGYHFRRFTVTVKFEVNMLISKLKRTGSITVQQNSSEFNGGSVAIYLEQPLWKNHYIAVGIKSNFVRYYYVVWPGFPTFDHYSYIPEFYMGLIL
ncbi:MAG: hypothetical protein WEB37_11630 [Bacteroidota bacterium]